MFSQAQPPPLQSLTMQPADAKLNRLITIRITAEVPHRAESAFALARDVRIDFNATVGALLDAYRAELAAAAVDPAVFMPTVLAAVGRHLDRTQTLNGAGLSDGSVVTAIQHRKLAVLPLLKSLPWSANAEPDFWLQAGLLPSQGISSAVMRLMRELSAIEAMHEGKLTRLPLRPETRSRIDDEISSGKPQGSSGYSPYIQCAVKGPKGTCYEGGLFWVLFRASKTYPFEPPEARVLTPLYHPRVASDGQLAIGKWIPATRLVNLLERIEGELSYPTLPDDGYYGETLPGAPASWSDEEEKIAREWTAHYAQPPACVPWSPAPEVHRKYPRRFRAQALCVLTLAARDRVTSEPRHPKALLWKLPRALLMTVISWFAEDENVSPITRFERWVASGQPAASTWLPAWPALAENETSASCSRGDSRSNEEKADFKQSASGL